MKAVLMSLNPQWFNPIMLEEKTREVRKRAPLLKHPYKIYLYCTKGGGNIWRAGIKGEFSAYQMNGTVCGEVTCNSTIDMLTSDQSLYGTCLTIDQLMKYAGNAKKLSYMALNNPILYVHPKQLSDFGLKRAPQSWQYVEVDDE